MIDIEFDIEEELTVDEVEIERILLLGIVEDILRLFDIDIYNLEDIEFDEVEVSYIDLISQLNIFLEMFEIKSSIDSDLDSEVHSEKSRKNNYENKNFHRGCWQSGGDSCRRLGRIGLSGFRRCFGTRSFQGDNKNK